MESPEYELMHAVEDRMWWYRGLRTLVAGQLARALSGARVHGPVLDAGCGTGGMLRVLGASVAGRPTLGLDFNPVAAGMALAKAGRPVMSGSVNEMPVGDGTLGGDGEGREVEGFDGHRSSNKSGGRVCSWTEPRLSSVPAPRTISTRRANRF